MIFKVGSDIIDTSKVPVGLVFKDKEEAAFLGAILSAIIDGDTEYSVEDNGNWWFMTPSDWSKSDKDIWSILTEEQKELLKQSGKLRKSPSFQL